MSKMTSYTIAYSTETGMLVACIPDGGDMDAAIAAEGQKAGISFDIDDLTIEDGLTLADEAPEGADIRYSGQSMGWLSDEAGRSFEMAYRV